MPLFLLAWPQWLPRIEWLDRILALPWERIYSLYIGEKLALGALAAVTFIGAVAALDRFFSGHYGWPKARRATKPSRRKKGLGVKWLVLLLIALLPGGLAGMAAVYAVMGKEDWRHDALYIVGASFVLALVLVMLRQAWFPWPDARDSVYVSGLPGLVFGLLQLWATIKLLRQWWGEPDECVPWWPPGALLVQTALLAVATIRMLEA